ncbi:MAG: thiamine pyrophosphate-dependent enzyme, partial [Verrucomicrobiota bacterium]
LCPGCPHRSMLHFVGQRPAPLFGDIGCYTLGALPPMNAMSTALEMGASIPMAEAAYHLHPETKPVCMIGDGTFLHAGIPGLISAVENQAAITVLIMDNATVGMTGQQPTGTAAHRPLDLAALGRGLGVNHHRTVDGHDRAACETALNQADETAGVSVIIVHGPCVLDPGNSENVLPETPVWIDHDACTQCGACLELACPSIAIATDATKPSIDSTCVRCGDCVPICNDQAIRLSQPPAPLQDDEISGWLTDPEPAKLTGSVRIVLGSVGGQGGIRTARLLAEIFQTAGWHCASSEIHAMAQRAGVVKVHLRASTRPVHAPTIEEGDANVGLFAEPIEAFRSASLLEPGALALVSAREQIPPLSSTAGGTYPDRVMDAFRTARADLEVAVFQPPGDWLTPHLDLLALLGGLARRLPFDPAHWDHVLRNALPPRHIEKSLAAFRAGLAQP